MPAAFRIGPMIEAPNNKCVETICQAANPSGLARELALAEAPSARGPLARITAPEIVDSSSLRAFVRRYNAGVMTRIELPAVRDAYWHAAHYEVRELIALDIAVGRAPALQRYIEASRAAGRRQLRRLLPMRDQRMVRRYWNAIERGEAYGCHAVVFGMVLSLFSLPLRQGLLHYAHQTLAGFVRAGARRLALPPAVALCVMDEATRGLPATVEELLAGSQKEIQVVRSGGVQRAEGDANT